MIDDTLIHCRAGTIISETWEDGQVLKDLNAYLVSFSFFMGIFSKKKKKEKEEERKRFFRSISKW